MKRKQPKQLVLASETLRLLAPEQLQVVAGGFRRSSRDVSCDTACDGCA